MEESKIAKLTEEVNTCRKLNAENDNESNQKSLLEAIKNLLEGFAEENELEINPGVILNLSVYLLQIIINNNVPLLYDEETKQITSREKKDLYSVKEVFEKVHLTMHKVEHANGDATLLLNATKIDGDIFLNAEINNNTIKGKSISEYDSSSTYDFSVTFDDNGLLTNTEYYYQIMPIEEAWKNKNKWIVTKKTKYLEDEYKTNYDLIIHVPSIQSDFVADSTNFNRSYIDKLQKFIARIPGFIDTIEIEDTFYIEELFSNEVVESVFSELLNNNKSKKRKRTKE